MGTEVPLKLDISLKLSPVGKAGLKAGYVREDTVQTQGRRPQGQAVPWLQGRQEWGSVRIREAV